MILSEVARIPEARATRGWTRLVWWPSPAAAAHARLRAVKQPTGADVPRLAACLSHLSFLPLSLSAGARRPRDENSRPWRLRRRRRRFLRRRRRRYGRVHSLHGLPPVLDARRGEPGPGEATGCAVPLCFCAFCAVGVVLLVLCVACWVRCVVTPTHIPDRSPVTRGGAGPLHRKSCVYALLTPDCIVVKCQARRHNNTIPRRAGAHKYAAQTNLTRSATAVRGRGAGELNAD